MRQALRFKTSLLMPENAAARLKACLPDLLSKLDDIVPGRKPVLTGPETKFLQEWLESAFTARFTYWPAHSLLGLSGDKWPYACLPGTATHDAVTFQDSSDQDYAPSDWPQLLFFQNKTYRAMHCPEHDLLAAMDIAPSDIPANESYYRRAYAYKMIESGLYLKDWMAGKDNEQFIRFSLCAIDSWRQMADLTAMARTLANKEIYL